MSLDSYMKEEIKKKSKKIKFVKKPYTYDEFLYNPAPFIYKFYQICSFKDPHTNKYNVRTIIFNEKADIIKLYNTEYSSNQCNKLINSLAKETHRYKIYPTYNLDIIDNPDMDDLLRVQSSLLSNDVNNYAVDQYSSF